MPKKILLLHGNRQTGQLLLGRMDKLRKKLQKECNDTTLIAPDAPFPHPDDIEMRQWWNREGNTYLGLEQTIEQLQAVWTEGSFCGILGFSQGARLAHLISLCHHRQPEVFFPGLQFVIMVAGYDAPVPTGFDGICVPASDSEALLTIPNLHVWGATDRIITPDQSQAVIRYYQLPQLHEHEGGHHVPMRAANVRAYLDFIHDCLKDDKVETEILESTNQLMPNEEIAQTQQDEVEALTAIFPDEVTLISKASLDGVYEHPIVYRVDIIPSEEGTWPPHPIKIEFQYPNNYPQNASPIMRLVHDNNMMEFSSAQADGLLRTMKEAAETEEGMPCVLSCVYAARDYFESGAMETAKAEVVANGTEDVESEGLEEDEAKPVSSRVKVATTERIQECNLQGLEIAESVLQQLGNQNIESEGGSGKGGSWTYTIGLVGKPSAGKSTFFNAATAFARQRNDKGNVLGGATMAPHPFTTIDPNVGFCLVPAPDGSCPEEDYEGDLNVGSTHGRDSQGHRLVPVLLKDVAGLVPGAYQGRGRGNKFLNDLCDADVLIHVLDASGTADTEGNAVGSEDDGTPIAGASHPLNDLAWIRNELIEWVYTNLMFKWDTIQRKGRSKLSGMFSGYGQTQAVTCSVLTAVEKYLDQNEQRDHALDHLDEWDQGDVHRLVSAFLGVRFPMALALNKCDLPTSPKHVRDIQGALPVHGAHVGVPLSARTEMAFIRRNIQAALGAVPVDETGQRDEQPPIGVWQCLQSAITLREPVLVFPVCDFTTYAPIPGLSKCATEDATLPSKGMLACLKAATGSLPTLWDPEQAIYVPNKKTSVALRDAIVMKPGSTVEDVFTTLKHLGALVGEFVRAEAAGSIGAASRPVPKNQAVSKNNRILKIMTNKRTAWQNK